MRMRQKKKNFKRDIKFLDEVLHCSECGKKMQPWKDKFQYKYGCCNEYCYGKHVGVYA